MTSLMTAPCFSLVRVDNVRASEALTRYATGVPHVDYAFDEIRLVAPTGEPCAIPSPSFQSLDHEHHYTDGSIGRTKRILQQSQQFNVDWIDTAMRRRLERWQHDRAKILISPGFGRRTALAWRPREMAASTIADLTGRYTLTASIAGSTSWVWDNVLGQPGLMRYFNGYYAKVVKTPFGAGQVFCGNQQNRLYNASPPTSYPVGSSVTDSGWDSWGTWAADITRAFESNGFGVTDCPGALVVTSATRRTGDGTNVRVLGRTLPTAITGAGTVWFGVFLRGRGGSGLRVGIGIDAGATRYVNLANTDLSEWTLVWVGLYATNWPATGAQWAKIDLTPALGSADDFDLQVGPSVALWNAGTGQTAPSFPQWLLNTRASTDKFATTIMPPREGTVWCSFYVPSFWREDVGRAAVPTIMKSTSTDALRFWIQNSENYTLGQQRIAAFWGQGGGETVYAQVANLLVAGRVSTVAMTWDHASMKLYVNGTLAATHAGCPQLPTAAVPYEFFGGGDYSFWPLVPLALRIESEVWDEDRMTIEHYTASDPGTSEIIVAARGRLYEITDLPSTTRSGERCTQWLGAIGLRQVDYVAANSDLTSKEG